MHTINIYVALLTFEYYKPSVVKCAYYEDKNVFDLVVMQTGNIICIVRYAHCKDMFCITKYAYYNHMFRIVS